MRRLMTGNRLCSFILCLLCLTLPGCAWFHHEQLSEVPVTERPSVAILPFGIDVEITTLATVKTVEGSLSPEDEARQVAEAVQAIREEARWIFLSRLAARQGFLFVPLDQVDIVAGELGLKPGVLPTAAQLAELRDRLKVDLVVAGSILDYGKVRWQWLAAAAFADLSVEEIVLGLATAWNPTALLANAGYEVVTNSAVYLGGGYLFGVAFRPVRVEARAFETIQGYPIWQEMEESFFAYSDLKHLPESERGKKESQLWINLEHVMEGLADSLISEGFTMTELKAPKEGTRR